MANLKRWILHPFLFGIFPVLALLAYNISHIGPLFAIRPLLIALILATLALLLFRLFLRGWQKAAIAASLCMLLIFTYGHVFGLIAKVKIAGVLIGRNSFLATVWLILLAIGIWFIARKIKTPQAWTLPLNAVSLILVGISLLQIAFFKVHSLSVRQQAASAGSGSIAAQLHPQPGKTLPDIYYIVPEDYTRSDGLKQAYGYDNSSFLESLQQKGFYVVSCSKSNYVFSISSIAAALNMQYLDQLSSRFLPPNTQLDDLDPYLQNNAVRLTLKDLGYQFVSFQSGFPPTEFRNADLYLSPQTDIGNVQLLGGLTPFEAMLFRTTALDFFYNVHWFPRELENTLFDSAYMLHRDRILYELDKLAQVPTLPGPKFVFVHLLAPHNPFVFGPHGEILHRTTPFTLNDDVDAMGVANYTAGYTGQINYLDTRILGTVDTILGSSARPPIIILQSDTGSTRIADWINTNLSAIYFPEGGEHNLYPALTQVNTFRMVFNTYFGGNLTLLEDQTCNSTPQNPFGCTIKMDPNPQCSVPAKP